MAEQIFNTTSRITGINWDINKNTICLKSFKTIYIKKDNSELKVEFLDGNHRRCQLSLFHYYNLCDLRNSVAQIALLLKDLKCEPVKVEVKPKEAVRTVLLESVTILE